MLAAHQAHARAGAVAMFISFEEPMIADDLDALTKFADELKEVCAAQRACQRPRAHVSADILLATRHAHDLHAPAATALSQFAWASGLDTQTFIAPPPKHLVVSMSQGWRAEELLQALLHFPGIADIEWDSEVYQPARKARRSRAGKSATRRRRAAPATHRSR